VVLLELVRVDYAIGKEIDYGSLFLLAGSKAASQGGYVFNIGGPTSQYTRSNIPRCIPPVQQNNRVRRPTSTMTKRKGKSNIETIPEKVDSFNSVPF